MKEHVGLPELLKAVLQTGSGSAASLIFGTLAIKILALVLGPAGVGLFSLMRQTQQTALSLAISGKTALVQGLSSKEGQAHSLYLSTTFIILSTTGGIISLAFLVLAPRISQWVGYSTAIVRWLALPIVLGVIYNYTIGVLNSERAIGQLAVAQAANSATMALFAYPIAKIAHNGQEVALIGLMSAGIVVAIGMALSFAHSHGALNSLWKGLQHGFDIQAGQHFWSIAGTIFITSLFLTGKDLAVRSLVARKFGLSEAGVLDVAWSLSMRYVTLVLTAFGTYYLPTLSGMDQRQARADLIQRTLRLAILLGVPLIVTVVVLKPLVVQLLYSHEFLDALDIIHWMLIGDFFKITSWVLAYAILADADMVTYFWSELVSNGLSLALSVLAVLVLEWLPGVGVAFTVVYVCYFVFALCYTRNRYRLTIDTPVILVWGGGLTIVLAASLHTWSDVEVRWPVAVFWILVSLALSILSLRKEERHDIVMVALKNILRT